METAYPLLLFLVLGAVAIALCARVYRGTPEYHWLERWLWVALLLRLGCAAMFAMMPATRIFHEDADGYEWYGMALARTWHGLPAPIFVDASANYGYKYVAASIYYVFGQYAPLAAFFNCLIGTISVFLVYHLARQFFHPLVARRAALLTALVPSMVLWNATALKESAMSLLILTALVSCIALKRRTSAMAVVGIVASLAAMQPLRYYMVYFLGFAIVASLLLERGLSMMGGIYKQVLLLGVLATFIIMLGASGRISQDAASLTLKRVSFFRHNMATTAESGFEANADVSTPAGALAFLPIGMAELLLGPFPWQFGSVRALMAAPETIYWWLLFPSLIRGMLWSLRSRFAQTSPLLLFAMIMTPAYSLVHGNVGSGFRQRSQIFIILFIFTSFGLFRRRAERAGIDPDLLLSDALKEPTRTAPPRPPAPATRSAA
jgi:hypothetical protein